MLYTIESPSEIAKHCREMSCVCIDTFFGYN